LRQIKLILLNPSDYSNLTLCRNRQLAKPHHFLKRPNSNCLIWMIQLRKIMPLLVFVVTLAQDDKKSGLEKDRISNEIRLSFLRQEIVGINCLQYFCDLRFDWIIFIYNPISCFKLLTNSGFLVKPVVHTICFVNDP